MDTVVALWLALSPVEGGGEPIVLIAGYLVTPELCAMAGAGIEARVEASVPGIDVVFACVPETVGTGA